jgi:hypothetical protein
LLKDCKGSGLPAWLRVDIVLPYDDMVEMKYLVRIDFKWQLHDDCGLAKPKSLFMSWVCASASLHSQCAEAKTCYISQANKGLGLLDLASLYAHITNTWMDMFVGKLSFDKCLYWTNTIKAQSTNFSYQLITNWTQTNWWLDT